MQKRWHKENPWLPKAIKNTLYTRTHTNIETRTHTQRGWQAVPHTLRHTHTVAGVHKCAHDIIP